MGNLSALRLATATKTDYNAKESESSRPCQLYGVARYAEQESRSATIGWRSWLPTGHCGR
jgi:hypothetical protein